MTQPFLTEDSSLMKVSSVRREHGKAILTISNGEIYSMPRAMLRERPYKGGMPFEPEVFQRFLKERSYPFALDKAITLLSMRSRTEKEIVDALRRNAYPEETIARVMQRLHDAGYIDDAEFAAQFSAARVSRGIGVRRIRTDLRMKGVNFETIDQTVSELDPDEVLSGAVKAARKASRGRNLHDRDDRQRILASLARRGYDFTTARSALDALTNETADS